jgi:hypothetical protein
MIQLSNPKHPKITFIIIRTQASKKIDVKIFFHVTVTRILWLICVRIIVLNPFHKYYFSHFLSHTSKCANTLMIQYCFRMTIVRPYLTLPILHVLNNALACVDHPLPLLSDYTVGATGATHRCDSPADFRHSHACVLLPAP